MLQDDELAEYQALNEKVTAYNLMLADGVISKEQYAMEFGYELEPIDKAAAQQNGLIQAQTELRGTVGGLNGIIAINTAVSTAQMSRETAVNTLVNYYGYDKTVAESMITATPETPTPITTF